MDIWLVLRLVKFVGFALFAGGVMLATSPRGQKERIVAAWGMLPLGFFLSWFAGYGLLKHAGGSMGEGWVSGSMLLSIGALHLGLLGSRPAARNTRRGILARALLGATIGAMVGRTAGTLWPVYAALGAALAVGIALWLGRGLPNPPADPAPDEAAAILAGFWRWSRLEATSAIALFLVYMPLKYGAGIVLDSGQGWFGWVHGILTIIFMNGLLEARRAGGWSLADTGLAFVTSLLPGGAFWFERRMRA
jgi:integral membrane protein